MKIVICIKQVPDTTDIKWTENNTISREGVESIINPMDLYAIESGLDLKDKFDNTEIAVVTMGPFQAKEILNRAIAMGCDKGFLLSDRCFAGADTFATARTLASFIKVKFSDFDLILCGQFASDGDTAQTGPSLSRQLGVSLLTNVNELTVINNDLIAKRETETLIETYKVSLPALLCISKGEKEPRRPRINGFIKAKNSNIEIITADDINLDSQECGLKGSPTFVSRAFTPVVNHNGEIYIGDEISNTVNIFKTKISEYKNG